MNIQGEDNEKLVMKRIQRAYMLTKDVGKMALSVSFVCEIRREEQSKLFFITKAKFPQ